MEKAFKLAKELQYKGSNSIDVPKELTNITLRPYQVIYLRFPIHN